MNYKLAKRLKDAGFPQVFVRDGTICAGIRLYPPDTKADLSNITDDDIAYSPTLSELIVECGDKFYSLERSWDKESWIVTAEPSPGYVFSGDTPEVATANLWLDLTQKQ